MDSAALSIQSEGEPTISTMIDNRLAHVSHNGCQNWYRATDQTAGLGVYMVACFPSLSVC